MSGREEQLTSATGILMMTYQDEGEAVVTITYRYWVFVQEFIKSIKIFYGHRMDTTLLLLAGLLDFNFLKTSEQTFAVDIC